MVVKVDLTGKRFGQWEVLERLPGYPAYYRCRCTCGTEKRVSHGNLKCGNSTRCSKCNKNKTNFRHGMSKTNDCRYWRVLKQRGQLPEVWHDFAVYFAAVGKKEEYTALLPADPSKPLSPDNWRWCHRETDAERITANGKSLTIKEWAKELGISRQRVHQRLKCCITAEDALSGKRMSTISAMINGNQRLEQHAAELERKAELLKRLAEAEAAYNEARRVLEEARKASKSTRTEHLTRAERAERREAMREMVAGGATIAETARHFGVTWCTVSNAVKEKAMTGAKG